jgi:hypothetical protein
MVGRRLVPGQLGAQLAHGVGSCLEPPDGCLFDAGFQVAPCGGVLIPGFEVGFPKTGAFGAIRQQSARLRDWSF